ncbi:lytic polysaccharide monooxygenase/carbohydrate-binding module family 19 protein [Gigaspora margarita]|uniref:Lytic polysaccharide monooxygenase/carbohydrate-binding module family 19 protein n=1 Tax=Gigaspora margarita TaxID=4874 RepID=A0A8H4B3J6_GIGMA|nr:lytic polysaccharide monooxygenase/carbohydrate-binding module family 19 protein [Gigaspora margarita]
MKFISALIITFVTLFSLVSAHSSMLYPPVRGHPKNPNTAVQDFACIIAPLNGGGGCNPKPFPCGGYPMDKKVVTTFKAGQVIDVKFFNPNFQNIKTANPNNDQARHNGGLCEFALSYDGGKTYTVIATYHKTCPDIFFENWKVKIPENAPSCDNPGKCIFSWSWINAVGAREFYQNCADIKLVGNSTEPLPIIDITRANLPIFKNTITPEGDPKNTGNAKGSGPLPEDVKANLALKIGPNSSKPGSDKGSNPRNKNSKSKPSKSKPSPNNPNNGSNSPDNTRKSNTSPVTNPEQDSSPVSTPEPDRSPAHTPNQGSSNSLDGASCSTNGAMTCVNAGSTSEFATCDNGKQVIRQCPGVLVCQQSTPTTIACNFSKRR